MRIIPLLRCYELVLFADEADGVVGDIRHVARLSGGGAVYTPVGHFSAIPDEAEPEQPARWRVEAFLRTDIIHDPATSRTIVAMDAEIRATHYDPDLPRAIADASSMRSDHSRERAIMVGSSARYTAFRDRPGHRRKRPLIPCAVTQRISVMRRFRTPFRLRRRALCSLSRDLRRRRSLGAPRSTAR